MLKSLEHAWELDTVEHDLNKAGNDRVTQYYIITVTGSDEEAQVMGYAEAGTPTSFTMGTITIPRKKITVSERLTDDRWKVTVEYAFDSTNKSQAEKNPDDPNPEDRNDSAYSFEISTETRKMVYSFGLTGKFPSTSPDPQAGIRDGEGIDTIMPVAHFSETHSKVECTVAYRKRVASLVGRVNSGWFKGYAPGEVLFLGANGSKNGDGTWSITYKFATAEQQSGLTIGTITGISKAPWDCIWVKSRDAQVPGVGLVRMAQNVYTEKVYEDGDFGVLGI